MPFEVKTGSSNKDVHGALQPDDDESVGPSSPPAKDKRDERTHTLTSTTLPVKKRDGEGSDSVDTQVNKPKGGKPLGSPVVKKLDIGGLENEIPLRTLAAVPSLLRLPAVHTLINIVVCLG